MLQAYDIHSQEMRPAWMADPEARYVCPFCQESVVLKRGLVRVSHFAHRPGSDCIEAEPESAEHIDMKRKVFEWGARYGAELERQVIPGRRSDVVFWGRKIVVECQVSTISVDEWEARTEDYTKEGWAVLWIWHPSRLKTNKYAHGEERRIPAEILHAHRLTYGRVYTLDRKGRIFACHLERPETRVYEWYEEGGELWTRDYTPKTLRSLKFHLPNPPRLRVVENEGLRLVQLGERKFWG